MKNRTLLCLLLLIAFVFGSCSSTFTDLASSDAKSSGTSSVQTAAATSEPGISAKKLTFLAVKEANGIDEAAVAFAIDMLKAAQEDGENSMISPLSILTALGMTANGADGETLKQMEEVLFGGKSIEEFNAFYKELVNRITNPKKGVVALANSTWYRDEPGRLKMNDDFIKLAQENFKSEIKPSDFNDKNTVNLINDWEKTIPTDI